MRNLKIKTFLLGFLRHKTRLSHEEKYMASIQDMKYGRQEDDRVKNLVEFFKEQDDPDEKQRFFDAIEKYKYHNKSGRGAVEFAYEALKQMKVCNIHRNAGAYKALISIFPEELMVPSNTWQVSFMHYPKQQTCVAYIIEQMFHYDCRPDEDLFELIKARFGSWTHVQRRVRREMYWASKLKNINPYVDIRQPLKHLIPPSKYGKSDNLETLSLTMAQLSLYRMYEEVDLDPEFYTFYPAQEFLKTVKTIPSKAFGNTHVKRDYQFGDMIVPDKEYPYNNSNNVLDTISLLKTPSRDCDYSFGNVLPLANNINNSPVIAANDHMKSPAVRPFMVYGRNLFEEQEKGLGDNAILLVEEDCPNGNVGADDNLQSLKYLIKIDSAKKLKSNFKEIHNIDKETENPFTERDNLHEYLTVGKDPLQKIFDRVRCDERYHHLKWSFICTQSPEQRALLTSLIEKSTAAATDVPFTSALKDDQKNHEKVILNVEGPSITWIQDKPVKYYTLKSNLSTREKEERDKIDRITERDYDDMSDWELFYERQGLPLSPYPTVNLHEVMPEASKLLGFVIFRADLGDEYLNTDFKDTFFTDEDEKQDQKLIAPNATVTVGVNNSQVLIGKPVGNFSTAPENLNTNELYDDFKPRPAFKETQAIRNNILQWLKCMEKFLGNQGLSQIPLSINIKPDITDKSIFDQDEKFQNSVTRDLSERPLNFEQIQYPVYRI